MCYYVYIILHSIYLHIIHTYYFVLKWLYFLFFIIFICVSDPLCAFFNALHSLTHAFLRFPDIQVPDGQGELCVPSWGVTGGPGRAPAPPLLLLHRVVPQHLPDRTPTQGRILCRALQSGEGGGGSGWVQRWRIDGWWMVDRLRDSWMDDGWTINGWMEDGRMDGW